MTRAEFIAGDWGTTHLRLYLCDRDGTPLETASGPGAATAAGQFTAIFASATAAWDAQHGQLPTLLCGMVGSTIGWIQAPYVPCPARLEDIAEGCTPIETPRIRIVPGLSCQNRLAAPDFLRGEETQLLGALNLFEPLRQGQQLVCLPGTHTKWVTLNDGRVEDFLTAPTGELFAILRDHSVLARKPPAASAQHTDATNLDTIAFEKALTSVAQQPGTQILHRLFECRSRPLNHEFPAAAAAGYLSGLLIGSDVQGALRVLPKTNPPSPVVLIGDPRLTKLYATACAAFGLHTHQVAGPAASLAGLTEIYRRLS